MAELERAPLLASSPLPRHASSSRISSLDQFRGATMVCMLIVNFSGGFTAFPDVLKHGYHSKATIAIPDLVMPCFLFCVGFAFRITTPKRVRANGDSLWAATWDLFRSRCIGLIMLQVFTDDDFDGYGPWAVIAANGFGGWLLHIVRSPYLYDTLTQIAFTSLWTFWAFASPSPWARVGLLVFSLTAQVVCFATFYWDWVPLYGLDQGGYFGFFGWTLAFTLGSFVHDATIDATHSGTAGTLWSRKPFRLAACFVALGIFLCMSGYILSCLSVVLPIAPCYSSVYKGALEVPCPEGNFWITFPLFRPSSSLEATMWTMSLRSASLPYHLFTQGVALLIYTAFFVACDVGVSPPAFLVSAANCASSWYARAVAILRRGIHIGAQQQRQDFRLAGADERSADDSEASVTSALPHVAAPPSVTWQLDVGIFRLFGDNALAIYVIHAYIGITIRAIVPSDAPAWYVIIFGIGTYLCVLGTMAAYLRRHKLFLRL